MKTASSPEKSTNVRLNSGDPKRQQKALARRAPWPVRAGLGALASVAPALAERAALALWRRPKRTAGSIERQGGPAPGTFGLAPMDAGPGSTTFAPFGSHRLAVTRWG